MLVEVWSDVVCPWCYLGEHRFTQALDRFERRDEVAVVFRPFQLDPRAPERPEPTLEVYARKFGGAEQAARIVGRVTDLARGEGLEMHLDTALHVNTFDAHRAIALASSRGLNTEMAARLFRAYFAEELDVSDHDTLASLAAEVGLEHDEVLAALDSGAGVEAVREGLARADELEIHAVPTFVIDGRWVVPGAQEPETMLRLLERAKSRS